jgi:hypothetical protein
MCSFVYISVRPWLQWADSAQHWLPLHTAHSNWGAALCSTQASGSRLVSIGLRGSTRPSRFNVAAGCCQHAIRRRQRGVCTCVDVWGLSLAEDSYACVLYTGINVAFSNFAGVAGRPCCDAVQHLPPSLAEVCVDAIPCGRSKQSSVEEMPYEPYGTQTPLYIQASTLCRGGWQMLLPPSGTAASVSCEVVWRWCVAHDVDYISTAPSCWPVARQLWWHVCCLCRWALSVSQCIG